MDDFASDGIHRYPMSGVETWKNKKNKFFVFQCHYTADKNKRSEEFKKDKKSSLPLRKYMMEYEIHWESFSGLPVFGDTWNEKTHAIRGELEPHLGLPLLIGFDFGLTPAALIAQMRGTKLYCMREFVAVNMGAERFSTILIKELALLYPQWLDLRKDYVCFIDPSGEFRKDTDEGTCAKILDAKNFKKIIPGAIPFEERRTSVENFLTGMEGGEPRFQVSAANCPMLIKGFNGAYHFKEGQDEIEPNKLRPVKNEVSHIHDALQMICSKILKMSLRSRANIPSPSYIWNQDARKEG
jgi:hypothetical protein